MLPDSWADHIRQVVDEAPPLDERQRETVGAAFRSVRRPADTRPKGRPNGGRRT